MVPMVFWIVAAALTLAACMAVLLPLTRARPADAAHASHDIEVYRDQLQELDRDAARGLIDAQAAEQARAEIARRILKAKPDETTPARRSAGLARVAGLAAVVALPLVSWGLYGLVGAPGMPGEPLATRLARNPAENTVDELIARAERHLAENPGDARGWEVLGPVYMRQGRYADAVTAWTNSIRIAGSNAARETGLGEATTAAAGGVVTAEARAAFERALADNPNEPKARFILANALAQEGKFAEAASAWRALKLTLAADSPWNGPVDAAIGEAEARLADAAPGPDAAAVAAAGAMSPEEQRQMIEGMVANLDEKLKDNPDDLDGWQRLIRSYVVLGREADAKAALGRALAGLADEHKATVTAFAAGLGIKVEG
jgi:cytochrome c-type biogenesis protein CcmH